MNDNNQFVHNQEAFKLYKAKGYTKPQDMMQSNMK